MKHTPPPPTMHLHKRSNVPLSKDTSEPNFSLCKQYLLMKVKKEEWHLSGFKLQQSDHTCIAVCLISPFYECNQMRVENTSRAQVIWCHLQFTDYAKWINFHREHFYWHWLDSNLNSWYCNTPWPPHCCPFIISGLPRFPGGACLCYQYMSCRCDTTLCSPSPSRRHIFL